MSKVLDQLIQILPWASLSHEDEAHFSLRVSFSCAPVALCAGDLHLTVTDAIGRSDARVRAKLLKRLRKHGLTDQDVAALVEAWKRAADEHERLEGDAFALGGGRTAAPGPGRQME